MDLPRATSLAADVYRALVAGVEEEVEDARHLLRAGQLAPRSASVKRGEDAREQRPGQDRLRGRVEAERVDVRPCGADERVHVAQRRRGGEPVVVGPRLPTIG